MFSKKKKATKIDSHWFNLQTKKALGFVFQFYVDCLFIYLSIYQSIHQSIHQSISLSLLLLLSYCTLTVLTVFFYLVFSFETFSWISFVMHLTDVDLKFKGLTIYFHFLHSKDFFCDGKKWVFDYISVCLNCY